MKYPVWVAVPELGQLYIEKVLVTFDVPELFVCRSDKGQRYLAVYEDEGDYRYLLAEIDCALLHKMLQQELPIDQVFRWSLHKRAYRLKSGGPKTSLRIQAVDIKDLSPRELPDADTFFSLHNREIDAYRVQIERELWAEKLKSTRALAIGSVSVRYKVPKVSAPKKVSVVSVRTQSHAHGRYFIPWETSIVREGGSDGKKPAAILKSSLNQADVFLKPSV